MPATRYDLFVWRNFTARRIFIKWNFAISRRIKFIAQREILPGKNLCPIPAPINKSANKSREASIY